MQRERKHKIWRCKKNTASDCRKSRSTASDKKNINYVGAIRESPANSKQPQGKHRIFLVATCFLPIWTLPYSRTPTISNWQNITSFFEICQRADRFIDTLKRQPWLPFVKLKMESGEWKIIVKKQTAFAFLYFQFSIFHLFVHNPFFCYTTQWAEMLPELGVGFIYWFAVLYGYKAFATCACNSKCHGYSVVVASICRTSGYMVRTLYNQAVGLFDYCSTDWI